MENRIQEISKKHEEINNKIKNDKRFDENIYEYKKVRLIFKEKYTNLIENITNLSELLEKETSYNEAEEEDNPASVMSRYYQFVPNTESSGSLTIDGDFYSVGLSGSSNSSYTCFHSSVPINETNYEWTLRFDSIESVSCCGFGIISLDDTAINKSFTSYTPNLPLICLCCNGSWGNNGFEGTQSPALGQKLRNATDKILKFRISNGNRFEIIDPNGQIHTHYDMSKLLTKGNYVLAVNCSSGVRIKITPIF